MKKIIGKVCKSLVYMIAGMLALLFSVSLINEVGVLITIIIAIGGALVLFIIWAAINWGDL